MDTFGGSSMGLGLTSPITQSKRSLHALCKTGARGQYHLLSITLSHANIPVQHRCTAPHDDLDGDIGGPCSHVHTDLLVRSGVITLRELWDDYGIVGELLVCDTSSRQVLWLLIIVSPLQQHFRVQIQVHPPEGSSGKDSC